MSSNSSNKNGAIQVILPLEDFAEDLEKRLGRANGNIYHRRPGIEGVNDGQVMVRLKKKRFIVIDYSIQPNEADLQHASMSPHIKCPEGAGRAVCTVSGCNKVGVPVLLYDSEPHEPQSLYLRSGMCFTCQRNLNEKRRTQRKKPAMDQDGNVVAPPPSKKAKNSGKYGGAARGYASTSPTVPLVPYHQVLMAVTHGNKRIKLAHTNDPLTLAQDAIILNGPPDPTCKSARNGHGFNEIGMDLSQAAKRSLESAQALVHAVDPSSGNPHQLPPTSEDIARLYETSFEGLCKSLYLLTQWKESWDAAMAAAVHAQHMVVPPPPPMDHTGVALANAIPDIHHPHLHHHHHSYGRHPLSPSQASLVDVLHPSSLSGMSPSSNHHHHHESNDDGLVDAAVREESAAASLQHHHDSSTKADQDLMAAAAAAAAASGNSSNGDDAAAAGVIEL